MEPYRLVVTSTRSRPGDHAGPYLQRLEAAALALETCEVDEDFELGLLRLQRGELLKRLGDYLGEAQIDAVLGRRDRILELCGD